MRIGVTVRRHSTDYIDHPSGRCHHGQILSKPDKRFDEIHLGHAVQAVTGLFEKIQVAQGQRLERGTHTAFESSRSPSHRTDFSQMPGVQGDDPVSLTPFAALQRNSWSLYQRHGITLRHPSNGVSMRPMSAACHYRRYSKKMVANVR